MGRKSKIDVRREPAKYAVRYFYNRKQFVLAKNPENRFSFYDIDEIYKKPGYKVMQLNKKESTNAVERFNNEYMRWIGYEVDVEKIDTRYLVQEGYVR